MSINGRHCLSKIFQPITILSKDSKQTRKDVTSKSQRLMLDLGFIQQASPGCFHFLPLAMKSLNKLIKIVDDEMFKICGQKVLFPGLTNDKLWKRSGRLKDPVPELFLLKDRHFQNYILSPTHEEAATDLLSSVSPISYKHFPLRLYQISSKFRDEMKPRFGLMRGREFLMKDMYTFDVDIDSAKITYEEVCNSYNNIFDRIGLEYVKVLGSSGNIGGTLSHEYQFKAPIGEDNILCCTNCNYSANTELCTDQNCPNCGEESKISMHTGIEVGHTFLLGNKYSEPLGALCSSKNSKPEVLQMGSYGLGLSRILAASVEVLCSETEMRWPDVLAPYNVIILPPKAGSKEEKLTKNKAETLYTKLELIPKLKDNILLDNRTSLTIGRRVLDAKRVGYHHIIVINEKTTESPPLYELNDTKTNIRLNLSENELYDYIEQNTLC